MNKWVLFLCGMLVLLSCKNQKTTEPVATEDLVMYKASEMTLLMKEMYISNELLKEKIIKSESLGNFNATFLNIHKAVLTDRFERTPEFDQNAKEFIKNQEAIFSVSEELRVGQFNQTVNSCIACHETTCTGPIPRIKKLLID